MSQEITLSRDELHEITGYRQAKRIASWLLTQGFTFRLGGDGWPRVAREEYRRVMCGESKSRKRTAPDFSALQGAA
jgi:hypothetical protein